MYTNYKMYQEKNKISFYRQNQLSIIQNILYVYPFFQLVLWINPYNSEYVERIIVYTCGREN